jgi:hypothetical protein
VCGDGWVAGVGGEDSVTALLEVSLVYNCWKLGSIMEISPDTRLSPACQKGGSIHADQRRSCWP